MTAALRAVTAALSLALALAPAAARGDATTDASWPSRLDAPTARAVGEIVDAARAKELPTEPLIARALEGASRRAPGPRIVSAVRKLAADLERARAALGATSTTAELVAGSAALASGVPPATLARLRPERAGASVVMPLVVLTDLVARRVPVVTASAAVLAAVSARVRDDDLVRLRERIDRDIRAGASPDGATIACTRQLVGAFEGAAPAPRGSGARPGP